MRGVFVDANLLVLLVAGVTDPTIISRHKRLQEFEPDDFERLYKLVTRYSTILLTPNTLTEASNLLRQHRDPERSKLLKTLGILIRETHEVYQNSSDVVDHPSFLRLGLTDAGLLQLASEDTPLITVDLDLYLAASKKDSSSAVNYRHIQGQYA